MAEERLLTVRDVAQLLGISEKEVTDLAQNGTLPAYKVGGVYLRFKREQLEEFKRKFRPLPKEEPRHERSSFQERLNDFFYFNDFYILSVLIIILILVVILGSCAR